MERARKTGVQNWRYRENHGKELLSGVESGSWVKLGKITKGPMEDIVYGKRERMEYWSGGVLEYWVVVVRVMVLLLITR